MNLRIKRRRELEIDLRTAILGGQFVLHYQPVVKLQTGAVTGCEALLRWNHPQRGMIQPLEFIPVAEETELINAIGEWVIRQACCEAMKWPSHISVAVNVSPVQFRHSTLALTVAAALAESGLSANRLELEITESVLTRNNLATVATLHQLRDVGVRISMDDFGTAYSSLNYLRSFPFDKLKIDRSFIDDLATGNEAGAIVRAILDLARTLKMTTTAEGVETINQERTLLAAGCDEAQGFLFSRALPASEISEFLNSPKRSTLKRSTFVA
jgi:EAL domain-containing protein (putative c-di-GMP-specific phosphodiesterase class I)